MKVQRILDAAFFFVEINIFFGRLAGERIECCKNDIIDDNLTYCATSNKLCENL